MRAFLAALLLWLMPVAPACADGPFKIFGHGPGQGERAMA